MFPESRSCPLEDLLGHLCPRGLAPWAALRDLSRPGTRREMRGSRLGKMPLIAYDKHTRLFKSCACAAADEQTRFCLGDSLRTQSATTAAACGLAVRDAESESELVMPLFCLLRLFKFIFSIYFWLVYISVHIYILNHISVLLLYGQ